MYNKTRRDLYATVTVSLIRRFDLSKKRDGHDSALLIDKETYVSSIMIEIYEKGDGEQ